MPGHTVHTVFTGLMTNNTKKRLVTNKIVSAIPKSKHSAEHCITQITEISEILCSVCQR